ncbi:MAG: Polysaccharide biosynthesis protein [Parcubacteria group bacterium Gr01-1014_18]|nr:MAG: Polysaccharide biosynthesis protein [Parcubacteria group bacterium Greene0416_36]TSC80139.1 MAG: Polysaccharide biosynthesis protein [Parcubacteria group bacterium Gr01-1014_18]TSC99353.1 MAG: Polysaccharide biosynthesis protein [Parcubacteria group bacterium Greene1014_20]TSD06810.1 MAG: Polysaccharide biosynthesis protein [Parcubacteria group bacterium Greene0714_2]
MSLVIKNTTYLTLGFIGQKFLTFIYFTIVARMIGVENTGTYVFALNYTTLFSIFADLGLSAVFIREVARDKENTQSLFSRILGIKLVLAVLTYLAVVVSIFYFEGSSELRSMVYLSGILMALDSFTFFFWALFRGWQKLQYEAISVIGTQAVILAVGVSGLLLGFPIYILLVALIAGSLFNLVYGYYQIRKTGLIHFKPIFKLNDLGSLVALALPFALLGIFTKFFMSIDTVMLRYLGGDMGQRWVGLFSVAGKITFSLYFIPSAFAAAIFPAMSHYFSCQKDKLCGIFEQSMLALMVVSVPCAAGIYVLAPEVILVLYGKEFLESVGALQIMILSLPFIFLAFPVGSLLNACNYQKRNTWNMALVLATSCLLNLIFIPKWAYLGASWVAFLSNILLFILGIYYCGRLVDYSRTRLLGLGAKTVLAAAIMVLFVEWAKPWGSELFGVSWFVFHFGFLAATGAAIYLFLVFALRIVSKKDIKTLRESFFSKKTVVGGTEETF